MKRTVTQNQTEPGQLLAIVGDADQRDRASLTEAFAGKEYERCNDYEAEVGYQKVALYEAQDLIQHAAAQMPNGRWRSKMGRGPVIEHHSPNSLSGGPYGNPTIIMRKETNVVR